MPKYIWSKDKELNQWSEEIKEYLVDKTIIPQNFMSIDKVTLLCEIHGTYDKKIANLYLEMEKNNHPICPKCSRIAATKKTEQTNLEKYGTKAPAQNKAILEKMKKTNLKKYGVEFQVLTEDFDEKRRETNLKKYGEEYAILNKEVKAKATQTMKNKYGVEHALQNEEIFNKFKGTMNERHGVDFSLQNKDIREKFTTTMKDKYDVEHALQYNEFIKRQKETNIERFGVEHVTQNYELYLKMCNTRGQNPVPEDIFNIVNNEDLFSAYIDKLYLELGQKPNIEIIAKSLGYGTTTIAQTIRRYNLENKIHYLAGESYGEHEIIDFLKNYGIKYNHRYTKIGPELDIYLPEHDVGIEFNGLYWHSDEFKEPKYHYKKYKYYKDIGTRVINIYEDEWMDEDKREIVQSIILSACNISLNKTIDYARKLKVIELDKSPESLNRIRDFFIENHLQGFRNSSVYIGLVDDNNDIIECMSFGYPYFGNRNNKNKYQYELIRHCTKMFHNVVGGKEKIFKYFLNNYPYDNNYENYILTYCDIDKFDGNSYEKLGFKFKSHNLQVWGIEDLYTKRVFRNPSNNESFKTLPKIYGCGNNTYIYNLL